MTFRDIVILIKMLTLGSHDSISVQYYVRRKCG